MRARLGLLAAAALTACSLGLDFSPGVLLPSLDAGDGAAADAAPADVRAVDAPGADVGCERACTGGASCVAGQCVRSRCEEPEVDCGGMCADLQTDERHCGACGADCGSGAPRCCRGVCTDAPRCQ